MAQPLRDGVRTSAAIREAAAELFYERGYQAASLREIASAVGLKVGSLYNHLRSKEELLTDLMIAVMNELNVQLNAAVDGAPDNALARFEAAVACHVRFHAEHVRDVFIGNSELRSLAPGDREVILAARHAYEATVHALIDDVARDLGAEVLNTKLQTYSILAQGVHVASWYSKNGPLSIDEIVAVYVQLAVRQLGLPAPSRGKRSQRGKAAAG